MAFPLAFGFVPGALAEDGDPVDVLILADDELPVDYLFGVKLLGATAAVFASSSSMPREDQGGII